MVWAGPITPLRLTCITECHFFRDDVPLLELPPSPQISPNTSNDDSEDESEDNYDPSSEWFGMEIGDNFPPLTIENCSAPKSLSDIVCGRRVVKPSFLLPQLETVAKHPLRCTNGHLKLYKEIRIGLHCLWMYKCDVCDKIQYVTTDDKREERSEVNTALVWGALATGVGYSQVQEMLGVMDIPVMSSAFFRKQEIEIEKVLITKKNCFV